ncbi:dihydroneopterin aldolase [Pelagibacteraceae bacterium]|nr:dihydroneopterin aldolase [Pelagibacteraceae bacterium]|tara:strand:+ start:772 stop:1182 length:411 start_codon:yes stop_codon:yes gene_type:complete
MKKKNMKIIRFQKKEEYSYKRKVIISDLVFNTLIGIHDFEKEKKQQIRFNIEISINPLLRANENDLDSIVNYENIINKIKLITQKKHYNLLETLAEDIFSNLFISKNIIKIKLRIEKPEIIKNTSSVGVEITKKRK